jgi:hypothetical protein
VIQQRKGFFSCMGKQVTEPCGNNKGHNPTGQSLENDKRNYGTFQNLLSTFTVLISSHTLHLPLLSNFINNPFIGL